ncbi:MAG TPA: MFS transporter [Terracidiphilus sp.]|nr:MFS transporter [Terracidiphilus sp.]
MILCSVSPASQCKQSFAGSVLVRSRKLGNAGAECNASHSGAQDALLPGVGPDRHFLGMPLALLGGYIAIVFYMTGDGIEQAFLSKYLVNLGFGASRAALVFTVYGATAALSSWLSGVLADVFSPRRIMLVGVAWWLVFHVLFLLFGLGHANLALTLLFYGIRGFAYPLFFYGFFVWVVEKSRPHELAAAIGWTWAMFTIGYGIVGSYLPSFTIVWIGYMGTLWMSMLWVFAGGVLITLFTRTDPQLRQQKDEHLGPRSSKMAEISKCVTLIFRNRNIALALVTRIICNLSLFGFPVIMPLFYTSHRIGFSVPQWARIWGTFFLVQPVTNVVWGLIGDRIGWMRQMRWFGFVGCGTASLLFYWLPLHFPHNMLAATVAALLFAFTVTSFVPMGAIFPMMEPDHKGAAVSVQNLGGGLANFGGPMLAALILPVGGIAGVVVAYGVLYYLAAILTLFIHVDQPKGTSAGSLAAH